MRVFRQFPSAIALTAIIAVAGCGDSTKSPESSARSKADVAVSAPDLAAARQHFEERLRAELVERVDPWVLSHALLAFGPRVTVGHDARSAIEVLKSDFLRRDDHRQYFDLTDSKAGQLGEQHPHLVLKTLAELGIERELCQELAETAGSAFVPPDNDRDWRAWDDTAWFLLGVAELPGWSATVPIGETGFTIGDLARGVLTTIEAGDGIVEHELELERTKRGHHFHRPSSEAHGQTGIYAFTCGGIHLLQAALAVAERGWYDDSERERLAKRVDVFIERLRAESEFRRREYEFARKRGQSEMMCRQMQNMFTLKLLGHGLEVLARAKQTHLGDSERVDSAITRYRAAVLNIFASLDASLDVDRTLLPSLRTKSPILWQLWFGDGCHALHGLKMTDPGN